MADMQTYGYNDIQRYLQHKMTPQEMHAFEKALMDDPFLADALEGFTSSDENLAAKHLSEIERELKGENKKAKVVVMPGQKAAWWKVAAIILVVVTGGILTYPLLVKKGAEQPVAQQPPAAETATITDSVAHAEKPMAKVEVLQNKKSSNKSRTQPPITRPEEQAPTAAIQTSPLETDTAGVLTSDQASRSTAFMDTNAELTATLPAPANNNAEASTIEARKTAISPPSDEMDSNVPERDTNKKMAAPSASNSSVTAKETISNVRHLIEKKANGAEPIKGWKSFEQYLNQQIDSFKLTDPDNFKPENVHVEFSIDQQGQPTSIKIMENVNSITTERLVQILTNGPKWKNNDKDKKVNLVIAF